MHRLSRCSSELIKGRCLVSSRIAQLPMLLLLMQILLLFQRFYRRCMPKKTRMQVLYVLLGSYDSMQSYVTHYDFVHRGVGTTLRVMAQHARVLLVVAASYYHPHMIVMLTLSPACCVWGVRGAWEGLIRCRLLRCRGHHGGTLLLYMLGHFWAARHERVREEAATKTERRALRGNLLHVVQFSRGGISMCPAVLLYIGSLRCDTRGFMYIFCGSI